MAKKKKPKHKKQNLVPLSKLESAPGSPEQDRHLMDATRNSTRVVRTPTTEQPMGPELDILLRKYADALVDHGLSMGRRDVKKLDRLDVRNLLVLDDVLPWQTPIPRITTNEKLYMCSDYWYAMVPCFEKGAMQVNRDRYMTWEIEGIDMDANRLRIRLHDYVFYADGPGWQPGVHGLIELRFGDALENQDMARQAFNQNYALLDPENRNSVGIALQKPFRRMPLSYEVLEGSPDYSSIYRELNPVRDLRWPAGDVAVWKDMLSMFVDKMSTELKLQYKKTNLDNLVVLFLDYILKANFMIAVEKASRGKAVPGGKPAKALHAKPGDDAAQGPAPDPDRRKIRTIGGLTAISEKAPRRPRENFLANYTKISWKTRGHLRRLRSGKTVYVRESVHKRKCLQSPGTMDQAPSQTPVTVKFAKQDESEA